MSTNDIFIFQIREHQNNNRKTIRKL